MLLLPGCNCTYATPAPDTLNGTCVQSYVNHWTTEHASTGAANNHVCLFTEAKDFEWMVRVSPSRSAAWLHCRSSLVIFTLAHLTSFRLDRLLERFVCTGHACA